MPKGGLKIVDGLESWVVIYSACTGRLPSGQRQQTVNLSTSVFEGSNPSLPTQIHAGC